MDDSRATNIGKQAEIMSETIFSPSRVHPSLDAGSSAGSSEVCLQSAASRKKTLHRESCRSEIIKTYVELANAMLLDIPFVICDRDSPAHRLNAIRFVEILKSFGYHWNAMACCLAIEHMVYNPPPAYTDGQFHPAST